MLRGRGQQCSVLDGLLADVRAGRSRVLVVRGEAGIGKTALLGYAAQMAPDFQVARAEGVESEMELPFAALHQLCGRMLDRLDRLPSPQREALGVAFGLRSGGAPDRFLVGLAVLGLVSEVAADQRLLCLVDDAQWLDQASAQALAFVARRMDAETVALLVGTRDPAPRSDLAGLPELVLRGLPDVDARALLASVLPGRLDERVRNRIIAESGGNPLALLELPHGVTAAELAGGFGVTGSLPVTGRIEQSFLRRIAALPELTRHLLLLAAAEPTGDPALLWRAAGNLGISAEHAAAPAEADGLFTVGAQVTFRHPLVRSAVYQAATAANRRRAHRAIAEATDPGTDPDRRAWHRAQAAAGPNEDIASELERSASRAQARGGFAAAAAFLERAVTLTLEPARRAERALAAAQAPKLRGALRAAKKTRLAFVIIDGTLIPIDRVAADRPFYSGKHKKHGMNLQVIASPDGAILWVSGALRGSTHDLTAARTWGIIRELAAAGLIVLADKGYHGAGEPLLTPYRGRNKPSSQKDANRAHARLRAPGERANAQLKTWQILRKLRCCPWRAGHLAKAIHVLQTRETTG